MNINDDSIINNLPGVGVEVLLMSVRPPPRVCLDLVGVETELGYTIFKAFAPSDMLREG